jgi:hypothetical protein
MSSVNLITDIGMSNANVVTNVQAVVAPYL